LPVDIDDAQAVGKPWRDLFIQEVVPLGFADALFGPVGRTKTEVELGIDPARGLAGMRRVAGQRGGDAIYRGYRRRWGDGVGAAAQRDRDCDVNRNERGRIPAPTPVRKGSRLVRGNRVWVAHLACCGALRATPPAYFSSSTPRQKATKPLILRAAGLGSG
jgi:hypothetical protein